MTLPASGPLALTDIQTEFGGTNPIALGEYYAGGGLVPAGTSGTYGTVPSSGALSVQNFYGTTAFTPVYIEEVFSTYLYTGNGSTGQTITNGIDLAGKGGLIWVKDRVQTYQHVLWDTARGTDVVLRTDSTNANASFPSSITYNNNGFRLNQAQGNENTDPTVSWTFRKQPKFFDVVTYTGNNSSPRAIAHNLGSTPGCMIVKNTSTGGAWYVYHRSSAASGFTPQECILNLNNTNAVTDNTTFWASTAPTSTVFTVGSSLNSSGETYVAYLFAHNAGGFGLTGTDNVISCGTYTTNGSGVATVDLGYEPQWVLTKATSGTFGTTDWVIADNMRGMPAPPQTDGVGGLFPNLSNAEDNNFNRSVHPTSTGFVANQYNSTPYIYIAIRRGPMKVPTSGTSVYTPITYNGNGTSQTITGSVGVPDLGLGIGRSGGAGGSNAWYDRLRGKELALRSALSNAEYNASPGGEGTMTNVMNGMRVENTYGILNDASTAYVLYFMSRAPSFFDEVCYTGTGSNTTQTHNLGVAPELVIIKSRSNAIVWVVGNTTIGFANYLLLNTTDASASGSNVFNSTAPTSTVFSIGTGSGTNQSGATYVAYLFATLAGVSKVGSYTGTATTKQVDCGFAAGARFVLIKRTDSTGDWYVWDSARGIVSGNDPYLLLNSTAAEVTSTDYVDTYNAGFEISSTAPAAINANGGTFIFLAIA